MGKLTKDAKVFNRGMAVAAGICMSAHGAEVEAEEILRSAGLTSVKELRESGVDWYDIRILAPVLRHISGRHRPSRRRSAGRLTPEEKTNGS